ncbi:MAG TPA: 4Fe-4S dicluster domain-containing protein [Opitutaceae bacterium]|nr:4Fe-4S dicluster domain-containing protein [Opitutaceae bacterium]
MNVSRRRWLGVLAGASGWFSALPATRAAKSAVRHLLASGGAPRDYDPTQHRWLMGLDVDRCIGCGTCVDACKRENHVPEAATYFRTWIERYLIKKPKPGSGELRGEVLVDSPNGGRDGFPNSLVPREEILKAFFVPKLCNLCEHSPCVQACPVGATFDAPDGVVLVDPNYCIGCGFCIQACPYGCRFLSPVTHTAEKCTLCYHRITRGLKPACVEVCPTQARVFGDLLHPTADDPLQAFIRNNKLGVLKPHLGTDPRVSYAGLDKEVR